MSRLRWLCPFCDFTTASIVSNLDASSWQNARREIEILLEEHIAFHAEEMAGEVKDA